MVEIKINQFGQGLGPVTFPMLVQYLPESDAEGSIVYATAPGEGVLIKAGDGSAQKIGAFSRSWTFGDTSDNRWSFENVPPVELPFTKGSVSVLKETTQPPFFISKSKDGPNPGLFLWYCGKGTAISLRVDGNAEYYSTGKIVNGVNPMDPSFKWSLVTNMRVVLQNHDRP